MKTCERCGKSYKFLQYTHFTTKDEKGLPDFVIISRCKLDNNILPNGMPECTDCFESKSKILFIKIYLNHML